MIGDAQNQARKEKQTRKRKVKRYLHFRATVGFKKFKKNHSVHTRRPSETWSSRGGKVPRSQTSWRCLQSALAAIPQNCTRWCFSVCNFVLGIGTHFPGWETRVAKRFLPMSTPGCCSCSPNHATSRQRGRCGSSLLSFIAINSAKVTPALKWGGGQGTPHGREKEATRGPILHLCPKIRASSNVKVSNL